MKTHAEECDELLQLLCHRHRRQMLRFLAGQSNNTATIDELIDHIDSSSEDTSLAIKMFHQHLPKLDDSKLIEWDSRSETIRYYPDVLSENLLDTMERHNVKSSNA